MTVYAVGRFGMKSCKVDSRIWALLLLLTVCGSGCTICASPDLESYTTYGGVWHRTDREHGRVGSVFAPAGSRVGSSLAEVSESSTGTVEEVPPGDIVAPAEAGSADADSQRPPTTGDNDHDPVDPTPGDPTPGDPTPGNQPTKPDLRNLELEDIQIRQRQNRWQAIPEA